VYHITCTRLTAVAATSGSLAALGDSFNFSAYFSTVSKRYIGANDIITADHNQCDH